MVSAEAAASSGDRGGGNDCCAGSCGELCAIVTGHMQMEEPGKAPCGSPGQPVGMAGELGAGSLGIPIDKPRLNLRASQLSPGFGTKKRVLFKRGMAFKWASTAVATQRSLPNRFGSPLCTS